MNKFLQKLAKLFLGISMAAGVGVAFASNSKAADQAQATDYTKIATFDFSETAASGTTSTALTGSTLLTLLNNSSSVADLVTSATKNSGDVYSGKGSGGGSIPQRTLKVGKASGGGSISFTIGGSDNISKVVVNGHVWKTTSSISVNSGTAQTYSTAQSATAHPFEFELATPTKTITIAVTTSCVCVSSIDIYKTAGGGSTYAYSVSYNANGASESAPSSQSGTAASVTLSNSTLTKSGYVHIGWSISDNLSNATPDYTKGQTVTLTAAWTVTLYAHWKQVFTVTYNGNGSTGGSVPTDSNSPYDSGAEVTVLGNTGSLVKTGNEFLGWKIANTGDLLVAGDTFNISANTELFAQWGVNPYTSVYSTGFESSEGFTADNTYNSTKTQGPSGKQWTFYYGTPSTDSALAGSQSGQCRWYSSAKTNYPYMKTNFSTSKVKKVSFTYKVSSTNLDFKTQYSTDGSSWTDIETINTSSTSSTDYSKVLSSTVNTFYFRILVCLGTAPSSGNFKLIVDSVNFYQETSTDPSVTIDGNETSMLITEKEGIDVVKTLTLENVTMAELTYSYDDEKVDVDADDANSKITLNGLVVGGPYDVEIKKSSTTLFTIHFTVISSNVVTVTSEGSAVSLKEGTTLQLYASSSKGADTFTWSADPTSVATVSNTGLVTGVSEGSVTITAESNTYGTSGTKTLSVTFGADNSIGNFYDASTLSETTGDAATVDGVKNAFTGNSSVIDSVSIGAYQQTGKLGGLSLASGSKAGSITVTMKDAYKLKSISIWCAKYDNTTPTVKYGTSGSADTSATQLSNGGSMFAKGESLDETATPLTYTFSSSAKTIEISATSGNRWTIYKVILCWTTVEANELSFDVGSSFSLMNTITKTLHVKASPLYYNVELGSLTWNSTDTDVATVTSDGVVEAKSDSGSSTITATTSGLTATATMNAISKVASSVTIDGNDVNEGTTTEINGVTWHFGSAEKYGLDYKSGSTLVAYSRGSIRLQTGYIQNDTAAYFKIKKVIVALCLAADGTSAYDQSLTVAGSNTSAGGSDVSSTNATNGFLKTYTLAEGCDYVKISSSSTVCFNSVTIEYETPEETIYSVAEFILGLQPDRGNEVIGFCSLSNGTYKAAKGRMALLDGTARGNFQTSEDLTVVAARERYEIWARNNNDGSPYDGLTTISPSRVLFSTVFKDTNTVAIIVIISMVSVTAIGGYFFLRKRKENI